MSVHVSSLVWRHGPAESYLRLLLLAIADNSDDRGLAWPSVETLADKCCVDPRTVQRNLRKLEAAGWLSTSLGGGTRGQRDHGIPSRYQIDMSRFVDGDTSVTVEVLKGDTQVLKGDTQVLSKVTPTSGEPSVEPSKNRHSFAHTGFDGFDEFWRTYPKRRGKRAAEGYWVKAVRSGTPPATIMTGLCRQIAAEPDREPKFWKDPERWLRDRRWEDEVQSLNPVNGNGSLLDQMERYR